MKKTVLLALLPMLLFIAPAHAAGPAELSEVISALELPFRGDGMKGPSIADFQADFLQKSLIASLDRTQTGEGEVAVRFMPRQDDAAPRTMFRWEYRRPNRQEIVSDGESLWVYLPENRQVIISETDLSSPSRPNDPVSFLTGLGNLSRDFVIAAADPARDATGNYILDLKPRRPSPMIEQMSIVVDHDAVHRQKADAAPAFPMLSATVYDPGGNSTHIEFKKVRINRDIPESLFRFVPPEGVEILRPSADGAGF